MTTTPRTPSPSGSLIMAALVVLVTLACSAQPAVTSVTASEPLTASAPTSTTTSGPTASDSPSRTVTATATAGPSPSAACPVLAPLRGRDLEVVPTSERVIALTFDGGASAQGLAAILATLAAEKVPATFFVTGEFALANPALTRTVAATYPLGNHTLSHPDLTTLSRSAVVDQIRKGAAAIREVTGRDPHPYFRFPFGARDAATIALVNDECFVSFRWTVDSLGWQGTSGGQSVTSVRNRVVAALRPGAIVLMHVGAHPQDGSILDAAALPQIIAEARARGYDFITLAEAVHS